ncbi:MAG TPA: cobalt-precorrin-6A reductase, partial [Sporomusaceae bacterium]|nr:cobalt-precorrin-6A reductase [Sporomusaceae bacterium]
MILVLAGTLDGRQLAVDLVGEGHEVLLSVV